MSEHASSEERLLELLSDRALFGLTVEEDQELENLRKVCPSVNTDEMDHIVGLLEASGPNAQREEIPSSLKTQIQASAAKFAGGADPISPNLTVTTRREGTISSPKSSNSTSSDRRNFLMGIIAMAATLLFAMLAFWKPGPPRLSLTELRGSLIANAGDLVQVNWTSTAAKAYSGDVVWSSAEQRGYMTFTGLPTNDPAKEQYQLWIFDREQDERYPVDGGVFDVTGDSTLVAIDAKINVVEPTLFAITIEKPGGVVVSDRSRLPLIAPIE